MHTIVFQGKSYQRLPIKTAVVMPNDDLYPNFSQSWDGVLQSGDIITIAESVVAISQGRAYKFDEIQPSWLATQLSRCVIKVPYGIGLGRPQTMQLAIDECGVPRILLAAVIGAVFKLFGVRGMFYRIAGEQAGLVDGPCDYTLPPFNKYATKGPKEPQKTAEALAQRFGQTVAIVDANDL
jgi:F420-0:gamma-glutamyl ligase-like protein